MHAQSEKILEKYLYSIKGILLPGEAIKEAYNVICQVHAPEEKFADTYLGIIVLTDSRLIFVSETNMFKDIYPYSEMQKISVVRYSSGGVREIRIELRDALSQVDLSSMRGFSDKRFLDIIEEKSNAEIISLSHSQEPLSPEDAAKQIDARKFAIVGLMAILALFAVLGLLNAIPLLFQ